MQDLREILSSINDAVWSFDLIDNKFIYVNKRLEQLFQVPAENFEKSPFFWIPYVHPDDCQYVLTETENIHEKNSVEIEYRLVVNEEIIWVIDKKVVLYDEAKNPKAITSILSDITLKKTSESQLTDSKKMYRYLFINNPNPLWIYDKKTLKFLAVNHAAIAKYGYSNEEFLQLTIADIRPQEDFEELLSHVYSVKNGYSNPQKHWRHLKKNGEVMYVNVSGHGINYNGYDAELVMAHDITFEVENRKKITLAKENLDALINNINDDIWSIDRNYRIISANQSYKKNLEQAFEREIAIGESVFLPEYSLEDRKQWRQRYDRALDGESFTFIELVNLPGKLPYCTETRLNPITDKNQIIGVACISSNIQDKLESHEKIVRQNMRLREVISLASHEIRGPVATLLGLISAFNKDNPTDPFNEEVMGLITEVTTNLDAVLHELVDKSHALKEEGNATKFVRYNQSVNE